MLTNFRELWFYVCDTIFEKLFFLFIVGVDGHGKELIILAELFFIMDDFILSSRSPERTQTGQ